MANELIVDLFLSVDGWAGSDDLPATSATSAPSSKHGLPPKRPSPKSTHGSAKVRHAGKSSRESPKLLSGSRSARSTGLCSRGRCSR